MTNILFLYGATQTFTNTVYEHVNSFVRYSRNKFYYCHQDQYQEFNVDLSRFDVIVLHYSVRLPYDQVPESAAKTLSAYSGLKVLFIQDEYDHTHRAWHWIKRLGFQLVFTVVPKKNIPKVYPPGEFPGVRFVSSLTGYVPELHPLANAITPPSSRKIFVGYRGRALPIRYGQLGQEKTRIGYQLKMFCASHGIRHDIEWSESARIYGPQWYEFIASCRSTLGSESGSNVFDWDGTLESRIASFRQVNRYATDEDVYRSVVQPREIPGLMNQISPRIFEAIILRTALLLYEGNYSDVIKPMQHYIPVKKDGSNLNEVFALLQDNKFIDGMTERAFQEIILSSKFSYRTFVQQVDYEIEASLSSITIRRSSATSTGISDFEDAAPTPITTSPIRARPATLVKQGFVSEWLPSTSRVHDWMRRELYRVWGSLPDSKKARVRRLLRRRKKGLRAGA